MTECIGVLLPVYHGDRLRYLKESIESLLCQTYTQLKLYLLIDGPVESSVLTYLNTLKDPRIDLQLFPKNRGLAAVLNDGLDLCRRSGIDLIARMDADDISMPDRFEKQLAFLKSHQDCDVVGTAISEMNEMSQITRACVLYPLTHPDCFTFFQKRDPVAHPSVLFRARFFEKAGIYNPRYRKNQDTLLWYQGFLSGCQFANLEEPLLKFRVSEDFYKNRRSGMKRAFQFLKDRFKINRGLKYGVVAYFFAVSYFLITISPSFIRQWCYANLR